VPLSRITWTPLPARPPLRPASLAPFLASAPPLDLASTRPNCARAGAEGRVGEGPRTRGRTAAEDAAAAAAEERRRAADADDADDADVDDADAADDVDDADAADAAPPGRWCRFSARVVACFFGLRAFLACVVAWVTWLWFGLRAFSAFLARGSRAIVGTIRQFAAALGLLAFSLGPLQLGVSHCTLAVAGLAESTVKFIEVGGNSTKDVLAAGWTTAADVLTAGREGYDYTSRAFYREGGGELPAQHAGEVPSDAQHAGEAPPAQEAAGEAPRAAGESGQAPSVEDAAGEAQHAAGEAQHATGEAGEAQHAAGEAQHAAGKAPPADPPPEPIISTGVAARPMLRCLTKWMGASSDVPWSALELLADADKDGSHTRDELVDLGTLAVHGSRESVAKTVDYCLMQCLQQEC
jgi:hypothetical protein